MSRLINCCKKHPQRTCFLMGILASILLMVPYLILGDCSIITYHDQLDGELLNYILRAKYLFSGIHVYPELMNGLPDTGAVPPAPLFVLLYKAFQPLTAFLLTQWVISVIGFSGMYLLLHKITGQHFVPFLTACIFMLLPFYPVYGLCIPGQPLMLYCTLQLYHRERDGKSLTSVYSLLYLSCILLYALGSSLILVGFGWLAAIGILLLYCTCKAIRQKEKPPLSHFLSFITLLIGYLSCNISLIHQVLSPDSDMLSHKSALVHAATDFWESIKSVLYPGINYTETWHWIVLPLVFLDLLLLGLALKCKNPLEVSRITHLMKKVGLLLLFILVIVLFYGVYFEESFTSLKNSMPGAIGSFNLSRLVWMLPTAWCMLAGCQCSILVPSPKSGCKDNINRLSDALRQIIIIALFGLWGITVFLHSPLRANISKLVKGNDYYALDWNKFFACDIYSQIDETIGLPKEDYRVVSIGIYPAAASYNGFYCLDGYSNNYPLSYKHSFREVIAKELDKSEYLKDYFDNWGNRCYVLCAEYPGYYTFEKKWNPVINQLELNTERLKEMNCKYIFSAAYLNNSEELGLTLLRDEPFETEDSWYHIYVYKLN